MLRRLDVVLAGAPATVDPARVAHARALLDAALFAGAPGQRARVPFSELPETPAHLASRGPLGAAVADRDPPGGYHRLVLGRDVGVGRIATETILGVDYRGPAYAGRLPPAPFAAADAALQSFPGVGPWTSAEVRQRAHGDADAWSVGDYHVGKNITWALTGEVLDDDAATELLEPYRGHRFRVQQLLALMGARRPRHAPRMTLPTHTPYATRGRS